MSLLSVSKAGVLGAVGSALLAGTIGPPSAAEDAKETTVFDSIQQQVQTIFHRCRGAVVRVQGSDVHGELSGTGFFVDPNGTLYTSWGVGGEVRDIVVCNGDAKYPARRLVSDMRGGVAILKVDTDKPMPFLPLGSSRDLSVASSVMTVGLPMDLPPTPSFGMIGGFDIKYLGRYFGMRHIRANVAVQRGEGGAPLLNMRGEVVGILISSLDQGSASFVLPIEAAEKVRKDYVRFGKVRPGWMGIVIGEADSPASGSVARVEEIMPEGPAEKAGVERGDVLLQVGSKPVNSPEDMLDACFYLTADDEVPVRVSREGEEVDLKVRPSESPAKSSKLFPAVGSTMRPGAESLKLDARKDGQPDD